MLSINCANKTSGVKLVLGTLGKVKSIFPMMLYSAKRPIKLWNIEWEDNSF